jgi:hypothetical protein
MPKGQTNNKNGNKSSIPERFHAEILNMDANGKNATEICKWLIDQNYFKPAEHQYLPRRLKSVLGKYRKIQNQILNKAIQDNIIKISTDYLTALDQLAQKYFKSCSDVMDRDDNLALSLKPKYFSEAIKFAEWKLKLNPPKEEKKQEASKEEIEQTLISILEKVGK